MEIVYVFDPFDRLQGIADSVIETPRGVPSSRILRVSRTIEIELQRISAAIKKERTGSIQFIPVSRMAPPPRITAAVESVSPNM